MRLRLLGAFEACDRAGRPVAVKAKKNRALLAALALAPLGSMPRQRISSLLWSDRPDAQAGSSLRQALIFLRKDLAAIDQSLLSISNERVKLDLARVEVDAVALVSLAASDDIAALRDAAALYRGELLADISIRDSAFEEWLASERRRLADTASQVFEKLCTHETGRARIDVAKRLVALDALREASHRRLMQVYFEAEEKGLALQQYEVCRATLRSELGVAPGPQTEALHQSLLQHPLGQQNALFDGDHTSTAIRPSATSPDWDKPSVAVLPMAVIAGDAELEAFAGGLTEDIITGLSRISAIRVIVRNTMFTHKHRAVDVRDIGRELGARYVLEGSVRRSKVHTRVSAQLIEAATGHHIWAELLDRAGTEMLDVQDDISRSIVASVQTQLILAEGKAYATVGEPAASPARLLARSWQRFLWLTAESLADCRRLAERALELDRKSAMAHRMLAVSIYHQVYMGFIPWTEQALDELYAHANFCIEAEDADEYCHWAMACAHLLRKQHERAATSLRRALEINPNCSLAHGAMGTVLVWSGQHDASIQCNELAIRINPQDPTIFFRHFGLAFAHYLQSRYKKALAHASTVAQTRPSWWLGQIVCAASLAQIGRSEEARRTLDELIRIRPGMSTAGLEHLPFANRHDREHLADGLRQAGLPD